MELQKFQTLKPKGEPLKIYFAETAAISIMKIFHSFVDIENKKVDIQDEKVNIENILSEKSSDFSIKTTVHIHRLFDRFGFDEVFGRSAVMELLEMKSSGASKLISNLVQADIIEPVSGYGKGKYKFKK